MTSPIKEIKHPLITKRTATEVERLTYIMAATIIESRPEPDDWSPGDISIIRLALAYRDRRSRRKT